MEVQLCEPIKSAAQEFVKDNNKINELDMMRLMISINSRIKTPGRAQVTKYEGNSGTIKDTNQWKHLSTGRKDSILI